MFLKERAVHSLEKTIMEEISTLDEMRLLDVIAFIRYLKGGRPGKQKEIAGWFESVLSEIRELEKPKNAPASLNVKTRRRGK